MTVTWLLLTVSLVVRDAGLIYLHNCRLTGGGTGFGVKKINLALPNLISYHWASHLRFVTDCIKGNEFSFTDLESIGLDNVSVSDLPFVCLRKLKIKMKDNFIATHICKSLKSICKHFGLNQYSFLAPIANKPDFEYTCVDRAFRD